MSKSYCCSVVLLVLFAPMLLPASARADAPHSHQRALVFALSVYDRFPHSEVKIDPAKPAYIFPNLDCAEDAKRIEAALSATFHFTPDQMTVLTTPEETTADGIRAAFEKLIADTQKGDIVYIHYSGHGAQIPDKTSPGDFDDAIVPSDYVDTLDNVIPGKTLREYLKRLKAKGTSQIVCSFDCCHSATITRGDAVKRGLNYAEYAAAYLAIHHQALPPLPPPAASPDLSQSGVIADLDNTGTVILSACANDRCAMETQDADGVRMGRFSAVLSEVLTKATPETTYQQVSDQIKAIFLQKYSDQTPQLDGDPNATLLGGHADPPKFSILVSVESPGRYRLDAGKLQGMSLGSTFAIYAPNTTAFTDDAKIADAKIVSVDLTQSDLTVTAKKPGLTDHDFTAAHAVETTHDYGAAQLSIDPASITAAVPDQAPAVLAALSQSKMVTTILKPGTTPDVRLVRAQSDAARGTSGPQVVRGDTGSVLKTLDETQDLAPQISTALLHLAQYRYATTVLNKDDQRSAYQVKLRLVPCTTTKDADGNPAWAADTPAPATKTYPAHGGYFTLEAQNLSPVQMFVTVLDLDSDGTVAQAWPSPKHTVQDNVLPAGGKDDKWVKLWAGSDTTVPALFRFGDADAHEELKAIATDTYVDYRALVNRDAHRGYGPFDALLQPATGQRSVEMDDISAPASWATSTVDFTLKPLAE